MYYHKSYSKNSSRKILQKEQKEYKDEERNAKKEIKSWVGRTFSEDELNEELGEGFTRY